MEANRALNVGREGVKVDTQSPEPFIRVEMTKENCAILTSLIFSCFLSYLISHLKNSCVLIRMFEVVDLALHCNLVEREGR